MFEVIVAGAAGRMGKEVIKAVHAEDDMKLTGAVDLENEGEDPLFLATGERSGLKISSSLSEVLEQAGSGSIMVDFTKPQSVASNIKKALEHKVHLVVGTTGITEEERLEIDRRAKKAGVGVIIAPNFALGAVLMMEFAQKAARYFPGVEIVELHHDAKLDAPSGTSLLTADRINQVRQKTENFDNIELLSGCRGGDAQGIKIHSVRLPGLVAHQQVIFGGEGQILTIRHDSLHRSSFMPGVLLAIRQVKKLKGLVFGLENLLELE